jgi:hypothetical protein
VRGERGFLLPGALALLLVVTAAGGVMLARSRTLLASSQTALRGAQALHAADGGLETARAALAADPAWPGASVRVGACDVTVRVERAGSGWRVAVRAQPGDARVEADLDPVAGGLPRVRSWRRDR